MPTNSLFGGGASHTILNPLVAIAMSVTIILIFLLPREKIIIPFLATIFLVPFGQVIVVGGIHFLVYRILVLAGLARLLFSRLSRKSATPSGQFTAIDRAFTCYAVFSALTFILLYMQTQATIAKMGNLLDMLGGYFFLRFLIQDKEDVYRTIKVFAFIAVVVAACMVNEQLTSRNIFGLLGALPLTPAVRVGRIRSQGPFSVYVTAGAFGACLLPLFVGLWKSGQSKTAAILGVIASTVITVTSDTSTALGAYVAAIIAFCFWPLRKQMRLIRWGIVMMLVGLQLVMKAPVWALIARFDLTGSSSGYQRYMLVDNCIRHFSSWWLLGTKDFGHWGWDMWDTSNQFVACADTGGLAVLIFFIAIISRSFGTIGKARRYAEKDRKQEWFLWSLGAAVLANVAAFFGIGYFDQIQVSWYAFLAMISAATAAWIAQEERGVEFTSADSQLAHISVTPTPWVRNLPSSAPKAPGWKTCRGSES